MIRAKHTVYVRAYPNYANRMNGDYHKPASAIAERGGHFTRIYGRAAYAAKRYFDSKPDPLHYRTFDAQSNRSGAGRRGLPVWNVDG